MIQNRSTFFIGIFIIIISSSFLGLPSSWKTTLMLLSGLLLVALSVKITLPRKSIKNLPKKKKVTPVFMENAPVEQREDSGESHIERE